MDVEVRLVGGNSNAEGRVEVFYKGAWGTVCDDGWDYIEADVVCRMLNFSYAIDGPCCSHFGEGSGDVVLSNVTCIGDEANLGHCSHSGFGVYECEQRGVASAICNGMYASLGTGVIGDRRPVTIGEA